MNSRERVLCALNHEEPDRVPILVGTSAVGSMLVPACESCPRHNQWPTKPVKGNTQRVLHFSQQKLDLPRRRQRQEKAQAQ